METPFISHKIPDWDHKTSFTPSSWSLLCSCNPLISEHEREAERLLIEATTAQQTIETLTTELELSKTEKMGTWNYMSFFMKWTFFWFHLALFSLYYVWVWCVSAEKDSDCWVCWDFWIAECWFLMRTVNQSSELTKPLDKAWSLTFWVHDGLVSWILLSPGYPL